MNKIIFVCASGVVCANIALTACGGSPIGHPVGE